MIRYFKYFYKLIGDNIYIIILLNALMALIDGIGIVLFIPLLGIVAGYEFDSNEKLNDYIIVIQEFGIPLSLFTVLSSMVILFSIKGFINYLSSLYFVKIWQSSIRKVRVHLVEQLHYLNYKAFTQSNPGVIQNVMTRETMLLTHALADFTTTIKHVVVLIVYAILIFLIDYRFAILVILGGLLSHFIFSLLHEYTRRGANELTKIEGYFNKHLIEINQNYKYLKSTNLFNHYKENLKDVISNREKEQYKLNKLQKIVESIREPLIVIILALSIGLYVYLFQNSVANVIISLLLFYRALGYIMNTQQSLNNFLKGTASIDEVLRLNEFFDKNAEPRQNNFPFSIKTIELSHVGIRYDKVDVLKDVNIKLNENVTIGLVGVSGAGKTTIANVIAGLMLPDTGGLFVNGDPLEKNFLHAYRNRVGYVTQDPVVFDDTIFNNVTNWSEKNDESLKHFIHCIKMVNLDGFLDNLENKEDSLLGNNGILISGGQKQRIAIARELYRDIDLLIFDEATSSLGTESENIIQENIKRLKGKYMMVIIAHRLKTIKFCDNIYIIKEGNVADSGSFNEMYQESSDFRNMVELQKL